MENWRTTMKVRLLILLTLLCATLIPISKLITSAHATNQPTQEQAQRKIAPWVMEHTENGAEAEFLVILRDKADLSSAKTLQTKREKGQFVRDALLAKAQQSQAPLLRWLSARGIQHRSFYIVNAVWVKASRQLALEIAIRPEVERIDGNPRIR